MSSPPPSTPLRQSPRGAGESAGGRIAQPELTVPTGSSKKRGKKDAPDPPADPEPRASKRQRNETSLNEDHLASGEQPESAVILKQREDREYWETWSTPLLLAWILDFPDHRLHPSHWSARDIIISTLVDRGAYRPAGLRQSQQLAVLRSNWSDRGGIGNPAPGFAPAPGSEALQIEQSVQTAKAAAAASTIAHAERRAEDAEEQAAQLAADSAARALSSWTPLGPAFGAVPLASVITAPSVVGAGRPHRYTACRTCATRRPAHADDIDESWRCVCNRRGDLTFDDPLNAALMKEHSALVARDTSSASSSGSIGQSPHAHATAAAAAAGRGDAGLTALDRSYQRLAEAGGSFELFEGAGAGSPLTHHAALTEVRKAQGASATQMPSDQLIALIRSGKFTAISHAVPRQLAGGAIDEEQSMQTAADGTLVMRSKAAEIPPTVATLHQFCKAMFSTIIPALIDRPAALMQWVTLGRTALQLEEMSGSWGVAASYMTQLLNERVIERRPFAETSAHCLSTVMTTHTHRQQGPPRGPPADDQRRSNNNSSAQKPKPPQAEGPGDPSSHVICEGYNNGYCTWRSGACTRAHKCRLCKGAHRAGRQGELCEKKHTPPPPPTPGEKPTTRGGKKH